MRENEFKARKKAKELRQQLTKAETILWSKLKEGRARGYRFRRQHPIGPYIADFACIRARLVIEADGATHWTEEEQIHDRVRDRFMRKHGWRVMRIQNEDVYENLYDVLDAIFADVPAPTAGPLRQRA